MKHYECRKCTLRYSSYCLGCKNAVFGINGDDPTADEIAKTQQIIADVRKKRTSVKDTENQKTH